MIPDQIEKDMLIEAPQDIVWAVVTEPDQIAQWFSEKAEIDPRPGGAGKLIFGEDKVEPFVVETFQPTSTFSFRWCSEEPLGSPDANALLVTFTLTAEGDKTRLRMVESGHGMERKAGSAADLYADHVNGWDALIPRLVSLATSRS